MFSGLSVILKMLGRKYLGGEMGRVQKIQGTKCLRGEIPWVKHPDSISCYFPDRTSTFFTTTPQISNLVQQKLKSGSMVVHTPSLHGRTTFS